MIGQLTQCGISVVVGCWAYVALYDPVNPKVALLGALILGIGAAWLATFAWVLVRHGWRAAKSISWSP